MRRHDVGGGQKQCHFKLQFGLDAWRDALLRLACSRQGPKALCHCGGVRPEAMLLWYIISNVTSIWKDALLGLAGGRRRPEALGDRGGVRPGLGQRVGGVCVLAPHRRLATRNQRLLRVGALCSQQASLGLCRQWNQARPPGSEHALHSRMSRINKLPRPRYDLQIHRKHEQARPQETRLEGEPRHSVRAGPVIFAVCAQIILDHLLKGSWDLTFDTKRSKGIWKSSGAAPWSRGQSSLPCAPRFIFTSRLRKHK